MIRVKYFFNQMGILYMVNIFGA